MLRVRGTGRQERRSRRVTHFPPAQDPGTLNTGILASLPKSQPPLSEERNHHHCTRWRLGEKAMTLLTLKLGGQAGRQEKWGHQKPRTASFSHVVSVNSLALGPCGNSATHCCLLPPGSGFLGTSQQRKQAAISEGMGRVPVSTQHLRSLVGGRQLPPHI